MWMAKPTWRMSQMHWRRPKRKSSSQIGGMCSLFTLQQENLFRQTDSLSPAHTIAWANVAITGCTDCFYKQSNVLIAPQCHSVYIFLGNQPINSVCIVVCVYQLWKKKAEMTCLSFFFFFCGTSGSLCLFEWDNMARENIIVTTFN